MKEIRLILVLFFLVYNNSFSQELYINTEPASLIPKGSKVIRLNNSNIFLKDVNRDSLKTAKLFVPSFSYGISKRIMLTASFQFSNDPDIPTNPKFGFNGFKLYSKQRIFSTDKQKFHTRLSSFIKYAYHDDKFMKDNLDIDLQDTGLEFGLLGTQLIEKLAISITSGLGIYTTENLKLAKNCISFGYLVFPRKYKSYKQTNFNIYFEYMTNTVLNSDFPLKYDKFSYTIAPGIQFIIFSRSRLDFSYKKRKGENKNEFLVKLTYIIY